MAETAASLPPATRAFLVHLAVYAGVNAGLAALNLLQSPEAGQARTLWFQWPLLGWGIGVAAHGLALLLARRARAGGLLADADVRGVAVHLFVYVAVNVLLIAVNLTASPGTPWFLFPLLGWGAGVAAHAFLVYRAVTLRTVERYAAGQRALEERNVARLAAEIAEAVGPAQQSGPARNGKAGPAQKDRPAAAARAKTRTRKPATKPKAGKTQAAKTKTGAAKTARAKAGAGKSAPKTGAPTANPGKRASARKRSPAQKHK